jgi:hypothetical protein
MLCVHPEMYRVQAKAMIEFGYFCLALLLVSTTYLLWLLVQIVNDQRRSPNKPTPSMTSTAPKQTELSSHLAKSRNNYKPPKPKQSSKPAAPKKKKPKRKLKPMKSIHEHQDSDDAKFQQLRRELIQLLRGDSAAADRLITHARKQRPFMGDVWYAEKVLTDLERDRRS